MSQSLAMISGKLPCDMSDLGVRAPSELGPDVCSPAACGLEAVSSPLPCSAVLLPGLPVYDLF